MPRFLRRALLTLACAMAFVVTVWVFGIIWFNGPFPASATLSSLSDG